MVLAPHQWGEDEGGKLTPTPNILYDGCVCLPTIGRVSVNGSSTTDRHSATLTPSHPHTMMTRQETTPLN